MNQFIHIPTYLVYGDSGSGKSSFIKCLGGVDLNNQTPKTGGLGVAVTTEPGKIYRIQDEILGHIQLIDTRGTWDPGQLNNDEILANLIKTLLDYSVQEMSEAINPIQQLDGILYVHNSFIDRYARNTRITQLGLLIGSDLKKSTISILTRYKEMQVTNLKDNFFEWTKQLHSSPQEYIYWDSLSPIQQQKEKLKELLGILKPIQLNNIQHANEQIIEIAKQLQQKDLIEVEEQRVKTVEIKYKKEKLKQKSSNTNITLTCNPPKGLFNQIGGWIPVKLPFNLQQGSVTETSIRINADFPPYALPPKLILSCELDKDLSEIKGQNLDLVSAEFINNGDYYDAHFKYRWNGGNQENIGRVDLRVKMMIQYRQVKEKTREEKQEYKEKVLKPRYSDEKPYIKQAMEEQFEHLCNTITETLQKQ